MIGDRGQKKKRDDSVRECMCRIIGERGEERSVRTGGIEGVYIFPRELLEINISLRGVYD